MLSPRLARLALTLGLLTGGLVAVPALAQEAGDTCGGHTVTIWGTEGVDELMGTNAADVISTLGGDDKVWGLGGDDVICTGDGDDRVFGGSGDNVVFGGGGRDKLRTGGGADTINAGTGDDIIKSGHGDDVVIAGGGHDIVRASRGNDVVRGGAGVDWLWGGGEDDLVFGGAGDDIIKGSDGVDVCVGGPGNDFVHPTCEYDDPGSVPTTAPPTTQPPVQNPPPTGPITAPASALAPRPILAPDPTPEVNSMTPIGLLFESEGWIEAAAAARHYGEATGTTMQISMADLLADEPAVAAAITAELRQQVEVVVELAAAQPAAVAATTFEFESDWVLFDGLATGLAGSSWGNTLGRFRFAVKGDLWVGSAAADGSRPLQLRYRAFVLDLYDFDPVEFASLWQLHTDGEAAEFLITGTGAASGVEASTATLNIATLDVTG